MTDSLDKPSAGPLSKYRRVRPRRCVQIIFLFITLFVGISFYYFVDQLESGSLPIIERPPEVEAFLPISALVSLKYLLVNGEINPVHPAGLVLFMIICATAFVMKKGFCSWICPIGLISDYLSKIHRFLFKKPFKLPFWIDSPMRGIKYFIAGFFLWSIFFNMPASALEQFINSPYNTFADIKMLKFFTDISNLSLLVVTGLLFLSVLIQNFWCRYLCPYGALLAVIGIFSMGKIQRNDSACIKCGKCETICPGHISIIKKDTINSLECSACLRCVEICPQENAIGFFLFSNRVPINPHGAALILLTIVIAGISAARLTGHWQNDVPVSAYRQYILAGSGSPRIPARMSPERMEKMIKVMQENKSGKADLMKDPGTDPAGME